MPRHPHLEELEYLLYKESDIELTSRIYEEKTGSSLPKDRNYLIKKSALANWLKEKGYIITDIEEKPIIEKTIYIKKKEGKV